MHVVILPTHYSHNVDIFIRVHRLSSNAMEMRDTAKENLPCSSKMNTKHLHNSYLFASSLFPPSTRYQSLFPSLFYLYGALSACFVFVIDEMRWLLFHPKLIYAHIVEHFSSLAATVHALETCRTLSSHKRQTLN